MNRRLLIVDSDANSLELLTFILSPPAFSANGHEPFDVRGVPNGDQAIDEAKAAMRSHLPFAGVLVDMGITGGLSGPDTLIRLRNLDPDLILVAITGGHAAASVGWDLLARPFTETEILQKANQIVSRWEISRRDRAPQPRRAK